MVKKAQVKTQQMAFMLMAITLLFILAGMFFLVVKLSGLKESTTELEAQNARLLASKLANSPEFSCGSAFGSNRINCIDEDKLMVLKESSGKYKDFWGVKNIEVVKIIQDQKNEFCTIANYPRCNKIELFDANVSGFDISNFVVLCRKANEDDEVYDECEMARMLVSYEGIY